MIRVLLVDDHAVVRSGGLRLLEQCDDIRVVFEASEGEAAYRGFVDLEPDVLVTDLAMPGAGDGLALIRRVVLRRRHAAILVFSMFDSPLLVQRALLAGARGYLTKASPPDCLIDAVRALHAGLRYLGPDLPRGLLDHGAAVAVDAALADEAQRLATLTVREFETFRCLAEGHGVEDCARRLNLSPKTISNQQSVIKDKLNAQTLAAWAHLALRHGVIRG